MRKVFCVFIWLFLAFNLAYSEPPGTKATDLPDFRKDERILVLAPHPDDETIGCAGIIQQAMKAGAQVRVVYLTNGDHNEFAFIVYKKRIPFRKSEFLYLGEVRRKEAIKAMQLLGLPPGQLIFLGYPDFGTFSIFAKHWGQALPFKNLLTRVTAVPYKENFSFGAPYKGESILADLEKIIARYRPDKIFVSHPADVNADHKALYLFLEVTLSDLEKGMPRPQVYSYLIHRVGWPLPRRYHPELPLLPPEQFSDSAISWFKSELSTQELDNKYQAILCYKSQTESSAFYLMSFARKNELFSYCSGISLKKQISPPAESISFLGGSGMFTDSDMAALSDFNRTASDKGTVSYGVKGNSLLIRITKAGSRYRWPSMVFYLFGYSYKTPFARMPKIRVIAGNNIIKIFDGARAVKAEGIFLASGDKQAVLEIPLEALGDPDFILASVKTYSGLLSAQAAAFRRVDILNK